MATSSTGYCYSSDPNQNIMQNHLVINNQLQSLEPSAEMYNLTAGMEMIGFPASKNLHQDNTSSLVWKTAASKAIGEPISNEFYHHDLAHHASMISPDSNYNNSNIHDHIDPISLRSSCVFPCEGNERPSQGLSLSLSSSNPSTIGLQSFELRQQQQDDMIRFGPSSSRSVNTMIQQQPQIIHKFLGPAQELLNEFCNLGFVKKNNASKQRMPKTNEWVQDENEIRQSLYSFDLLELQKRKTKLLQMLEEVDRRYKHYCDQMKSVVSAFEAMAGDGAATVYSALASRAMSRHFRCLRDGIVSQIKATKKAMGDKDTAAPGTTKGETPRLRLIDQNLRQNRAFQQMSMMESHPWRPQRGLPERSVSVLRAWLFEHFLNPYPNDVDKHILARQTGLSRSQVSNWFINARVRLWKPMVEEMYIEELKDHDGMEALEDSGGGGAANLDEEDDDDSLQNQTLSRNEDQKPTHDQLARMESECLSSIIMNNPKKNNGKKKESLQHEHQIHGFGRVHGDSYGAMELDFSPYTHHSATGGATISYLTKNAAYGGGGGVSLTLGLHQHGESGGVTFTSQNSSVFYTARSDHLEDCQTVQYSLLDSEGQTLPYRNLMGAQLLNDLAG